MKKVIALLIVLFGVCMAAHAVSTPVPSTSQDNSISDNSASNSADSNDKQSNTSDADQVGSGSGDDADTANDKDPEADDSSLQ